MSSWMPQMNPQLLQAAIAKQALPPGAAPRAPALGTPAPQTMPLPQAAPPVAAAPRPMAAPAAAPSAAAPALVGQGMGAFRPAMAPGSTEDLENRAETTPRPALAQPQAPAPSDDPAQNPWAKATQDAQQRLTEEGQKVHELLGQQPTAPNRADYKPSIWRRLAAPLVGALAAQGHGNPEPAVDNVVNGPWNRAMGSYNTANEAWKEKVGAEERTGIPLAKDAATIAQQGFTNYNANRRENNEEARTAETAKRDTALEGIKQQVADLGKVKESDAQQRSLDKLQQDLELKSRDLDLKNASLEQRQQAMELGNQIKEMRMQADRDKFSVGTDAKSLEDERKARLASIENDWKQHPIWNKLTGDKNKDIQAVNDDINQRLAAVRVATGVNTATPVASTAMKQAGNTVTDTRGVIHTFPTKSAADKAFAEMKKAAGTK